MDNDNSTAIRCSRCGNVICVYCPSENVIVSKKHGRTITINMSCNPQVTIICEHCGTENNAKERLRGI